MTYYQSIAQSQFHRCLWNWAEYSLGKGTWLKQIGHEIAGCCRILSLAWSWNKVADHANSQLAIGFIISPRMYVCIYASLEGFSLNNGGNARLLIGGNLCCRGNDLIAQSLRILWKRENNNIDIAWTTEQLSREQANYLNNPVHPRCRILVVNSLYDIDSIKQADIRSHSGQREDNQKHIFSIDVDEGIRFALLYQFRIFQILSSISSVPLADTSAFRLFRMTNTTSNHTIEETTLESICR